MKSSIPKDIAVDALMLSCSQPQLIEMNSSGKIPYFFSEGVIGKNRREPPYFNLVSRKRTRAILDTLGIDLATRRRIAAALDTGIPTEHIVVDAISSIDMELDFVSLYEKLIAPYMKALIELGISSPEYSFYFSHYWPYESSIEERKPRIRDTGKKIGSLTLPDILENKPKLRLKDYYGHGPEEYEFLKVFLFPFQEGVGVTVDKILARAKERKLDVSVVKRHLRHAYEGTFHIFGWEIQVREDKSIVYSNRYDD